MGKIDAKVTKDIILKFLEDKGPSLPVQLAKATGLNTIFTSAFLSELASEGAIKISNMKVGGSPLYFLPQKANMLENFTNFLGAKEREAQQLLKKHSFLEDREQTPVIRVALRGLKDFAVPLKYGDRIVWRYYLIEGEPTLKLNSNKEIGERRITEKLIDDMVDEKSEFRTPEERFEEKQEEIKQKRQELEGEKKKLEEEEQKRIEEAKEVEKIRQELEEKRKELEKLKNELQNKPEIKKQHKKINKIKKEVDESFLNQIKEILIKKGIDLLEILEFDKKQTILKVKRESKELILFAFDKKKIEEEDLIKAHRKANSLGLSYELFFKGELSKKIKETIEAYKNLNSIEKFE
ncbi:hypothetical protein FJZ17_02060 [Candidatus Pacearchaeota archaeon]|nr:hypothetical protein [Candidatus Pacearchaeota archaeon]